MHDPATLAVTRSKQSRRRGTESPTTKRCRPVSHPARGWNVRSRHHAELLENRLGTYAHPIILNAADGAHTAQLLGDINMFNTRYFYLTGADIIRDGDAFHCEQCSYTHSSGVAP